MVKKVLFFFFFLGMLFVTLLDFNRLGERHDELAKDDATIRWLQQDKEQGWVAFDRHAHDQNRTIRSIIHFKKQGELKLHFALKPDAKVKLIRYHIKKGEREYTLRIDANRTATVHFLVQPKDKLTITIKKVEAQDDDYWGTLTMSFEELILPYDQLYIVVALWGVMGLFLIWYYYGYLALLLYGLFMGLLWMERFEGLDFGLDLFLAYSVGLFFVGLVMIVLFRWLTRLKVATVVNGLLLLGLFLLPMVVLLYGLIFDLPLSQEALYALFQTNLNEGYEFIWDVGIYWWLGVLVVLLVIIGLLYQQERSVRLQKRPIPALYFLVLFMGVLSYGSFSHMRTLDFLLEHTNRYLQELLKFKAMSAKRQSGSLLLKATKKEQGETYIVVIGESLNKRFMSLYGYNKRTTPQLNQLYKEGKLLRFDRVYSNHVHTMPTLSFALTQANQYNHKTYFESPSIIDILNQSHIKSYWLTNQVLYGGWDNMVSILAHSATELKAFNHTVGKHTTTQSYDGVMIATLKKILAHKSKYNRVIFVHLMGNHSRYALRYPLEYAKFHNIVPKRLEHYLNSLYYNDEVISQLIQTLQKEVKVGALLYVSDHGEEVLKGYGHNIDRFTYEMTNIPLLIYLTQEYQSRYPQRSKHLDNHTDQLFTNDLLYDTLIGLFGIQTPYYEARYDLASASYTLKDNQALLNHGKQKVNAKENPLYWDRNRSKQ